MRDLRPEEHGSPGVRLPDAMRRHSPLQDELGQDVLRLLVRDAHTLYACWELSDRRKRMAALHFVCEFGQLPQAVRLHDVTGMRFDGHNANRSWDIPLTADNDHLYIDGLGAGTVYIADLGVYTWERQFVPLLRSRAAMTPHDCPAVWGEPLAPVVPEAAVSRPTGYIPAYGPECFAPSRTCSFGQ